MKLSPLGWLESIGNAVAEGSKLLSSIFHALVPNAEERANNRRQDDIDDFKEFDEETQEWVKEKRDDGK